MCGDGDGDEVRMKSGQKKRVQWRQTREAIDFLRLRRLLTYDRVSEGSFAIGPVTSEPLSIFEPFSVRTTVRPPKQKSPLASRKVVVGLIVTFQSPIPPRSGDQAAIFRRFFSCRNLFFSMSKSRSDFQRGKGSFSMLTMAAKLFP